ncbi:MAG: ROK family protein [Armatimonadetes bacterium]|nr:ROK family protein [Armatimonadota bacterium]
MASDIVIGIDLGGTNVRAQAYDASGRQAGEYAENPSNAQKGTQAIFDEIVLTVTQAIDKASAKPKAVGLAIPGHVDNAAGVVRWAPNFGETVDGVFRYWQDVDVRGPLESRLNLPVVMDNDANLAALGEYRFGSGKDSAKCLVMLTLGTGVGGGVVMRSESLYGNVSGRVMLLGGNKGGAELGHVIINANGLDCNSGEYGSIEAYCQRDSIIRRAQHRLMRGRESTLRQLCGGDYGKITPKMISDAASAGDELAIEVLAEVGTFLGYGIGALINVFAPDVFAMAGKISLAGDLLLEPARRAARNVAIPSLYKDCKIVVAEQIEIAGILGAATLAMEAS